MEKRYVSVAFQAEAITSGRLVVVINTKKYHDFFCYFIRLHYLCTIKYNTI